MRAALAAAAVIALGTAPIAAPASAETLDIPAGTYAVDNTHLSILWRVSHFGLSNYTGQFDPKNIEVTIDLDPENVANSKVTATIPATDVMTNFPGEKDFDAEIAGEKFLNAGNHPEITFTSTDIEVTGENTAEITGDLTIAGTTVPVVLDTRLNAAMEHPMANVPALGITAVGTLKRTDFGVDFLVGPVADDVEVIINAEFLKEGE